MEEETFEEIGGVKINYRKVGYGVHNVLLIPGAVGSWRTDYRYQMNGGLRHEKFTIVGFDPPGLGLSRPPDRSSKMSAKPGRESYNAKDAAVAHKLMERLDLLPYSVLGYDDGGVTAMYLAQQQKDTDNIVKLILWGTHAYMTDEEADIYESVRDTSTLSSEMRTPLAQLYGPKYFQSTWAKYLDTRRRQVKEYDGDICKDILKDIKQSTLILHGANDWLCPKEHPHYLKQNIKDSHLIMHEKGQHNLHIRQAEWFNQEVDFYLLRTMRMLQGFEKINATRISYARIGTGKQFLLCCPSAMGSWRIDFRKVLEDFDHDEFTVVAFDPAGYGMSRPPDRTYANNTTEQDATIGLKLMKKLDLIPFSVLGVGEGGETAIRLAVMAPRSINKLVIWSTLSHISKDDVIRIKEQQEVNKWPIEKRKSQVELYGGKHFEEKWKEYCEFLINMQKLRYQGDICRDLLGKLQQKVLILHGVNDSFSSDAHAHYLSKNIPKSKLIVHPDGDAKLQTDQFLWFRKEVEAFFFADDPRQALKPAAQANLNTVSDT